MSTTRIFTALLAVGAALAKPIAIAEAEADNSFDLGPGIPTAAGLTITSVSYFGDGCPEGSLDGKFCPETSSFNVSISDLKAMLQDGKSSDDASCHIEVGIKTHNQIQLNLLQGDFYGSVYLEERGMTALAHSSVSFAGSIGGSSIPYFWHGPVNTKSTQEHKRVEVFVSPCSDGGEFLMLVDLVLHVTRGSASADAVGFVDIDQLTGALSQAYVLKPSACGQTIHSKPPGSESSHSGGSYDKEEAKRKKEEEKRKKKERKEKEKKEKKEKGGSCGHDYEQEPTKGQSPSSTEDSHNYGKTNVGDHHSGEQATCNTPGACEDYVLRTRLMHKLDGKKAGAPTCIPDANGVCQH